MPPCLLRGSRQEALREGGHVAQIRDVVPLVQGRGLPPGWHPQALRDGPAAQPAVRAHRWRGGRLRRLTVEVLSSRGLQLLVLRGGARLPQVWMRRSCSFGSAQVAYAVGKQGVALSCSPFRVAAAAALRGSLSEGGVLLEVACKVVAQAGATWAAARTPAHQAGRRRREPAHSLRRRRSRQIHSRRFQAEQRWDGAAGEAGAGRASPTQPTRSPHTQPTAAPTVVAMRICLPWAFVAVRLLKQLEAAGCSSCSWAVAARSGLIAYAWVWQSMGRRTAAGSSSGSGAARRSRRGSLRDEVPPGMPGLVWADGPPQVSPQPPASVHVRPRWTRARASACAGRSRPFAGSVCGPRQRRLGIQAAVSCSRRLRGALRGGAQVPPGPGWRKPGWAAGGARSSR